MVTEPLHMTNMLASMSSGAYNAGTCVWGVQASPSGAALHAKLVVQPVEHLSNGSGVADHV